MIRKEGSQNKLKKIPEGQEYAPRLEPVAPIRLAEKTRTIHHAVAPSSKKKMAQ